MRFPSFVRLQHATFSSLGNDLRQLCGVTARLARLRTVSTGSSHRTHDTGRPAAHDDQQRWAALDDSVDLPQVRVPMAVRGWRLSGDRDAKICAQGDLLYPDNEEDRQREPPVGPSCALLFDCGDARACGDVSFRKGNLALVGCDALLRAALLC